MLFLRGGQVLATTIQLTEIVVVVVIQALYGSITTRQKYKGTSSMNCRERGSQARGV